MSHFTVYSKLRVNPTKMLISFFVNTSFLILFTIVNIVQMLTELDLTITGFILCPYLQELTLKTVCACPGACDENGPVSPCKSSSKSSSGSGIGGGTVFLIM